MRITLTSTGGKVLASTVLLGAAASVAGLGTFGTFTSTTSASAAVASGTVKIDVGAAGTSANRLSVGGHLAGSPATPWAARSPGPAPATRPSPASA